MSMFGRKNLDLPSAVEALPGRDVEMPVPAQHHVLGTPLKGPFPEGVEEAVFGMGCFWGPSASSGKRTACTRLPSATRPA